MDYTAQQWFFDVSSNVWGTVQLTTRTLATKVQHLRPQRAPTANCLVSERAISHSNIPVHSSGSQFMCSGLI